MVGDCALLMKQFPQTDPEMTIEESMKELPALARGLDVEVKLVALDLTLGQTFCRFRGNTQYFVVNNESLSLRLRSYRDDMWKCRPQYTQKIPPTPFEPQMSAHPPIMLRRRAEAGFQ
jgi:hypothetical protein